MKRGLLDKSLRQELWRTPDLLGFAAHWTWIWCVFWSSLFYGEDGFALADQVEVFALEPLWAISLLSNVVTMAFLLMLSHFRNPLSSIRALPWAAAGLTALGTILISHPTALLTGPLFATIYPVGAVLTGIGSAMIVVLWGELFASFGSRRTINYCVLSFMLAALGFLVITALPPDASQVLVALLPFASILFLLRFIRSIPHVTQIRRNVPVVEKPPYKLIAISLFFGISFGIMKGLFAPIGEELTGMRDLLNIAAIVGASIAVFVTTNIYKMDFDHMTYQVALPLMAAGFLFLPLSEPWNVVGTGVHQFGYQYFFVVLWAIWPVLASRANVPSGWIAAWGLFSIQLGQLIGSFTSAAMLTFLHTELDLAMLSASIIFLILLIALFALGSDSANTGWGFVKPIEEADSSSDFEKTCTRLARTYRLSPREIEVFFLLSKGRNRAHIKDELVVSDETVKSHIKNIYRKTDVHSQQELIDMIETENTEAEKPEKSRQRRNRR